MRILIAEDEQRLAEALARGLRRDGWAVDVALDGASALERTALVDYDASRPPPAGCPSARCTSASLDGPRDELRELADT